MGLELPRRGLHKHGDRSASAREGELAINSGWRTDSLSGPGRVPQIDSTTTDR